MARSQFGNDKIPSGYRAGQLQQFTKPQMKLQRQRMSELGPESYLSKLAGGDQEIFNEIEAPALRQFNETLGGISSRFSAGGGRGSLGTRKSSGFQNANTSAARNFAQELQANRQSLSRQAMMDLHDMSNKLLNQRPYERIFEQKAQKENKALGGWGGVAGGILGAGAGFLAGGPAGAITGAGIGSNAFSGL